MATILRKRGRAAALQKQRRKAGLRHGGRCRMKYKLGLYTRREGLLVAILVVTDYSEERIGQKDDTRTAQADHPRIAESRLIGGEFGPSILFCESADGLQHQVFAVILIGHQNHTITLLICEENRQESGVRPGVPKIPTCAMPIDHKPERIVLCRRL